MSSFSSCQRQSISKLLFRVEQLKKLARLIDSCTQPSVLEQERFISCPTLCDDSVE